MSEIGDISNATGLTIIAYCLVGNFCTVIFHGVKFLLFEGSHEWKSFDSLVPRLSEKRLGFWYDKKAWNMKELAVFVATVLIVRFGEQLLLKYLHKKESCGTLQTGTL